MFVAEMIYALSFGLGIAWLFGSALGNRGPWDNIFWFFCVIFCSRGVEASGLPLSDPPGGGYHGYHF